MKRFSSLAASLLLAGSTGLALAQTTPVASNPTPAASNPTPGAFKIRNPYVKLIVDRIMIQENRITMGVKNGRLTAEEAAALRAKLVSVKEELRADFKANRESGQKGLTDAQIEQFKAELNANSAAIHDEKVNNTMAEPAPATTAKP